MVFYIFVGCLIVSIICRNVFRGTGSQKIKTVFSIHLNNLLSLFTKAYLMFFLVFVF